MQKIPDRGVPPVEQCGDTPQLRDWDGAHAFLDVVRRGSFRAAAQACGISVSTLRRRIENLEAEIGTKLLVRHVEGVALTREGEVALHCALQMERARQSMQRLKQNGDLRGEVRIGITEGLGAHWLAPQLAEFQRAHPAIMIDLTCTMQPSDVLRLECDLSIRITRPEASDLRLTKLGRLHVMPYAARGYLEARGTPQSMQDFAQHHIVLQMCEQIASVEGFSRIFPNKTQRDVVSFRSNVSTAHFAFIACGGGIGMLPTYTSALTDQVVPIDIDGLRLSHDIWLVYHPDAAETPRVRTLIDWIVAVFSSSKYPWFADDFIHPRDLPRLPESATAAYLRRQLNPEEN